MTANSTQGEASSAFYNYYIDRHGVEPDNVGADKESQEAFIAGAHWQAALASCQSLQSKDDCNQVSGTNCGSQPRVTVEEVAAVVDGILEDYENCFVADEQKELTADIAQALRNAFPQMFRG